MTSPGEFPLANFPLNRVATPGTEVFNTGRVIGLTDADLQPPRGLVTLKLPEQS